MHVGSILESCLQRGVRLSYFEKKGTIMLPSLELSQDANGFRTMMCTQINSMCSSNSWSHHLYSLVNEASPVTDDKPVYNSMLLDSTYLK